MRVLLVEDLSFVSCDPDWLRSANMLVERAGNGQEALETLRLRGADLVVLELQLSDMDGYEVLRRIRTSGSHVPVLMISALSRADAKVKALHAGADDYLTRPFDRTELIARIRAILRRSLRFSRPILEAGPVKLDINGRIVTVEGKEVSLTGKEYSVLESLMRRKGATLTKETIMNCLYTRDEIPEIKIIDVFVCKLRRKLADAGADKLITTVWGRGYTIGAEPVDLGPHRDDALENATNALHPAL